MDTPDPGLARLADALRISTSFTDWRDERTTVPDDTVRAVLGALGVDPADPDAALAERVDERWRRVLPPVVVARRGRATEVPVHAPAGARVRAELVLDGADDARPLELDADGEEREVDGRRLVARTLRLPDDVAIGDHRIRAVIAPTATVPGGEDGGGSGADAVHETPLVVAPDVLGMPDRVGDDRLWGFAVQLYSVRSARSWGVGDLGDLRELAVWSARELGAGFVQVNPLHAAQPVAPLEPSPYLPTSRRFVNPLYLRVEDVPEYAALDPDDRARIDALAAGVRDRAAGADLIDRDDAWTAKREALALLHAAPRSAEREAAFTAYREREGDELAGFAAWSALAVRHGGDARAWPEELRDPASVAVADALADTDAGAEAELAAWLQWQLDEQLHAVQTAARGAGMPLGVVHDLAVGVQPGGADAWRLGDVYAAGFEVGAPPDAFNQLGQNWRQPPYRPDRLADAGYAPLRSLARALLRHGGGIRIDHIIGMFRLWWVPDGAEADAGTYVRYDSDAILGVLALEAARAGAVIIGEDLGVVEPSAREDLAELGVLGTSILWFERDGDGAPLPAERWRELCLASASTHDLPPTAGYLTGVHVDLRDRLGLLTRPVDEERAADDADRRGWLDEVRSRVPGVPDDPADDLEATIAALDRYVALTPARLVGVALTDATGDVRVQNQPGTLDEHPNWRIPLSGPDGRPVTLEQVTGDGRARRLGLAVRDALADAPAGHRDRDADADADADADVDVRERA